MSSTRTISLGGRAAYHVADLVAEMVSHGAEFREPPISDGEIHRASTAAHPRKKNFSYVLYPDGLGCWFENHECGDGPMCIYLARGEKTDATPGQREQWEAKSAERAAKTEKRRLAARDRARSICLNECLPAASFHQYLVRKHIRPYELLQRGVELVVPIVSVEGEIQTIERIYPTGDKKFLTGGSVAGNFYALGDVWTGRRLLICEGVATAHSLFEATGMPTVAALFAGNLEAVGRVISKVKQNCKITLCADDDWRTKGNPGLTAATKAAAVVDGRVVVPDFTGLKRGDKDTDFNDLQILAGLHVVRRQIIWGM